MGFGSTKTLNIEDPLTRAWVSGEVFLDPITNEFITREQQKQRIKQAATDDQKANWEKAKAESPQLAAQANQATIPPPTEERSIVGMVNVPVATDFTESKQSLNELTTQRGDLASIPDIDLCGFMSNLPDLPDIEIPDIDAFVQDKLNQVFAAIQGVTLPAVTFISNGIDEVVGTIDAAVGELGAVAQSSIPTISCGKKPLTPDTVGGLVELGSAFSQPSEILDSVVDAAVDAVPYGTTPNIIIESPEVTVDALDDEIDLGEF